MPAFFTVELSDDDSWALDLCTEEAPFSVWECKPVAISAPIPLRIFENGE